jgi:oxalate decarboxylase/phosphoglucose isomerase-like protein (cupin superfamily)
LVFGTEDLPTGETIPTHRHPGPDEILFLETGTARVHSGDTMRVVHAGLSVFIPAGTRISGPNIGGEVINLALIFSAPGFEAVLRDEFVRDGEKNAPVSEVEGDELQKKHSQVVIYKEP